MNTELDKLEQLFNITEPDRETMEIKLRIIGYGREYLEYLSELQIRHLYYDEFGDVDD